jgi:hypothetical protein
MAPTNKQGGGFSALQHMSNGETTPTYSLSVMGRQPTSSAYTLSIGTATGVSAGQDISALGPPLFAAETPATWDASCDLTIECSADDATYYPICDNAGSVQRIYGIGTVTAQVYFFGANVWPAGVYRYVRFKTLQAGAGTVFKPTAARSVKLLALY